MFDRATYLLSPCFNKTFELCSQVQLAGFGHLPGSFSKIEKNSLIWGKNPLSKYVCGLNFCIKNI